PLPDTPVTPAPLTPAAVAAKSPASTPVTASLNVTVNCTLAALVRAAPASATDWTAGGVLSIVYAGPVVKPVPGWALPAASLTVAVVRTSRRSVPLPLPVPTVTV